MSVICAKPTAGVDVDWPLNATLDVQLGGNGRSPSSAQRSQALPRRRVGAGVGLSATKLDARANARCSTVVDQRVWAKGNWGVGSARALEFASCLSLALRLGGTGQGGGGPGHSNGLGRPADPARFYNCDWTKSGSIFIELGFERVARDVTSKATYSLAQRPIFLDFQ